MCESKKETIHQSLEVLYKKVDHCPLKDLQLTFFQMAYIISGKGFLSINGHRIAYQTGNLMLLTPNDYYNFDIEETTEFLLIRFTSDYVKKYKWKNISEIECLLYYSTHLTGCILRNVSDYPLVKSIIRSLLQGIEHSDLYEEDLQMHFVNALIVIAARNIAKIKPANLKVNADKRIQDIIDYIQTNIFSPQKLKVSVIAEAFDISDTYLGTYFKNQCGETIQHFMANYKIRLIEHRLQFSDRRINEIADEFGFADESHLNKFFKKHKSLSLTQYRKSKAA
ncbi:helix-turn-helix domain-containing protein [Paraflavitalea soli]|uniref:helix-turn-helix domain-containing protein n=1 Tax=Paraflavitalea soli TaxID=2315862 RepID=UPI001B861736|nr:AraC family transcriptional regulator [Paraflavitalea soli]